MLFGLVQMCLMSTVHVGGAHLWCCSGDQGAYRTPALCPLLEGEPVAPHPVSCRFHLMVWGLW